MKSAAPGPRPNRHREDHDTNTAESTTMTPLDLGTAYALAALRDKAIRRQTPASS